MTPGRLLRVALLAVLAAASVSCAYYNTFYLARKYYMKATDGQPYEVDREGSTQRANYNKAADYSKKLLGVHPKSKWVDDAWVMWARTFIGTDDPLKAVAMLEEFQARFPNSDLKPDAEFFLGLAYRQARRHETAVDRFNNFIAQAPRHELVPYAYYERSKALMSLRRYREAAESAGQILERFPKHRLADRALRQRGEARYQQRDWQGARADFRTMGTLALNDEDRLRYLLREVDCLESARQLDEARDLLQDARSHVPAPPPVPTVQRAGPNASGTTVQQVMRPANLAPGQDRYGKLTLRMGGVELLAGNVDEAVRLYQSVLQDYPRTALAAEAQFRIGFAYETGSEDFTRARAEYQKVKEQGGTSQFAQQAQQRTENLDRLERFRTASGSDSLARQAEARFLIAEHFLFSLDRPERAAQEYRDIADSSTDSAVVARALTAQGWVLARKLGRPAGADSLFWEVVRHYPRTEAQLAARDYLEAEGQRVDESLIVAPEFRAAPLLEPGLTPAPGQVLRPGQARPVEPSAVRFGPGVNAPSNPTPAVASRLGTVPDSIRLVMEMRDSLVARAARDTSAAGKAKLDSLRRVLSSPDTTGRGAMLAEFERSKSKPQVAPATTTPSPAPPASPPASSPAARGPAPTAAPTAAPAAGAATSGATGATGAAGTAGAAGATGAAATTGAAAKAATSPADTSARKAAAPPADTTARPVAVPPADTTDAGLVVMPADAAADTVPSLADTSAMRPAGVPADSGGAVRSSAATDTSARRSAAAPAATTSAPAATATTPAKPAAPGAKPAAATGAAAAAAKGPKLTPAQQDSARRAAAHADSVARAAARRDSVLKAQNEAFELRQRLQQNDPLRIEAARRDSVRRAKVLADQERRRKASADSLKRARAREDSLQRARAAHAPKPATDTTQGAR